MQIARGFAANLTTQTAVREYHSDRFCSLTRKGDAMKIA